MSEPIDLSAIGEWLDDQSRELHANILQRLGAAPETLPGRALLILQAWTLPVVLAATLVCALAGIVTALTPETPRPVSIAIFASEAAAGRTPRAADVYILARQLAR